eukprot:TRINITY_DN65181_c0_g1_i1.p1 TRINITY_DN65181_c0_g1~~TRINITY_DN65181_c0_g1_i1.p1  ORF type:complete len:1415 (+),score=326.94 TRINITY_DN65181_c0_g1_i1:91-4335(+)
MATTPTEMPETPTTATHSQMGTIKPRDETSCGASPRNAAAHSPMGSAVRGGGAAREEGAPDGTQLEVPPFSVAIGLTLPTPAAECLTPSRQPHRADWLVSGSALGGGAANAGRRVGASSTCPSSADCTATDNATSTGWDGVTIPTVGGLTTPRTGAPHAAQNDKCSNGGDSDGRGNGAAGGNAADGQDEAPGLFCMPDAPWVSSHNFGESADTAPTSDKKVRTARFVQEESPAGSPLGPSESGARRVFSKLRMQLRALNAVAEVTADDLERSMARPGLMSDDQEDDGDESGLPLPAESKRTGVGVLKRATAAVAVGQFGLGRLLPDARWRRWWDLSVLLLTAFHGIVVPLVLVNSISFDHWLAAAHVLLSLIWGWDTVIRLNTAFVRKRDKVLEVERSAIMRKYAKRWLIWDVLSVPPLDSAAFWTGADSAIVTGLAALRLARLWHVPGLFQTSNPGLITPQYVAFHFRTAPLSRDIFWGVITLHLLVVLKLAVAEPDRDSKDTNYFHSLFWVWNLLTTSPAPLTLYSTAQRLLCFVLMITGVFFQGVVIARVSYELLKNSIQQNNIETLWTTLQIVSQYNVPLPLQQEILSLQWHNLQSSLSAMARSDVIESLPPVMRNEILLYMKIEFITQVPIFAGAPHRTKVLLADSLEQLYFEPGEFIITYGEEGEEMYFLLHGYCDVSVPGKGAVGQLTRGQCFGELELLTGTARAANVRALTYCDCLCLRKKDFDRVCDENPDFKRTIFHEARKRGSRAPSWTMSEADAAVVPGVSPAILSPATTDGGNRSGLFNASWGHDHAAEGRDRRRQSTVADQHIVRAMAKARAHQEQEQDVSTPVNQLLDALRVLRHRRQSASSITQESTDSSRATHVRGNFFPGAPANPLVAPGHEHLTAPHNRRNSHSMRSLPTSGPPSPGADIAKRLGEFTFCPSARGDDTESALQSPRRSSRPPLPPGHEYYAGRRRSSNPAEFPAAPAADAQPLLTPHPEGTTATLSPTTGSGENPVVAHSRRGSGRSGTHAPAAVHVRARLGVLHPHDQDLDGSPKLPGHPGPRARLRGAPIPGSPFNRKHRSSCSMSRDDGSMPVSPASILGKAAATRWGDPRPASEPVVRCFGCGATVPVDSVYCHKCGERLRDSLGCSGSSDHNSPRLSETTPAPLHSVGHHSPDSKPGASPETLVPQPSEVRHLLQRAGSRGSVQVREPTLPGGAPRPMGQLTARQRTGSLHTIGADSQPDTGLGTSQVLGNSGCGGALQRHLSQQRQRPKDSPGGSAAPAGPPQGATEEVASLPPHRKHDIALIVRDALQEVIGGLEVRMAVELGALTAAVEELKARVAEHQTLSEMDIRARFEGRSASPPKHGHRAGGGAPHGGALGRRRNSVMAAVMDPGTSPPTAPPTRRSTMVGLASGFGFPKVPV